MYVESPGFQFSTEHVVEDNQARIYGTWKQFQVDAEIAPGQEFSLHFYSHGGPIKIGTQALRLAAWDAAPTNMARMAASANDLPTSTPNTRPIARENRYWPGDSWGDIGGIEVTPPPVHPEDPPPPPGGGGAAHVAVIVRLYAPGIVEPVKEWPFEDEITDGIRSVTYELAPDAGRPGPDAAINRAGWWRCTLTPLWEPAQVSISATATYALMPFRTKALPARLVRSLFRVAWEALVPVAEIDGTTLKVGISKELTDLLGRPPFSEELQIEPATSKAKLKSLDLDVVSARTMMDVASAKNGYRDPNIQLPADDDIAIHIQAQFSNLALSLAGLDDVVKLHGEVGELFIHIHSDFRWGSSVSIVAVDIARAAGAMGVIWNAIGSLVSVDQAVHDKVNGGLCRAINDSIHVICKYVQEGLARAVAKNAVVESATFAGNAIQVRYFVEPPLPPRSAQWYSDDGRVPNPDLLVSHAGELLDVAPIGVTPDPSPPIDPLGEWDPDVFKVATGSPLDRLDRHQSIVFVMMENRSFDHMLGWLGPRPAFDPNRYDTAPAGSSNPATDGFESVPIASTLKMNMGTVTPVSPHHLFDPTGFQIRDGIHTRQEDEEKGLKLAGLMQGFTRNVADRTDSPQIVMMTYQQEQLPTYASLARNFAVCDRWFAAHPGPTWPNRYATVTGHIPDLDNFEINDPRIGFLEDHSIWDTLTELGIEWKVFEKDLSLIRTFNRFRLDDEHVVHYADDPDGFWMTLNKPGPLPRVMFVEPNFTDLPPLATACDDLAPADLAHGQVFIRRVYEAIKLAKRDLEVLLVVTYDEHGGFWDHVPPPGTPHGDPSLEGKFAKLHKDGPNHLGVRVPAFVISPYVSEGHVCHETFDHTSVLKTILVHNRSRIPKSMFTLFGDRVNQMPHLGAALDRDEPREWPYMDAIPPHHHFFDLPPMELEPLTSSQPRTTDGETPASHRGHPIPGDAVPVTRLEPPPPVVVRRTSNVEQPADRSEFHSGLRDMFRPRR